jgi:hypothetical protein
MVKLVFRTADWDDTAQTHNALTTESKFLTCTITAEFNEPARATVVLYDTNGSTAQKYDVDAGNDSIYIGAGRAYIYDDDDAGDASVFDGRIVSAISDMANHRLILECEDWLSQLDDDRIDYDMREDLDGSGLRQSGLKSDLDGDTTTSASPTYTTGADYYMYDDDMDWALDAWNGYYVALPIDHVGDQTVTAGPYTYSGDYSTATGTVDAMWTDDDDSMYFDRAAAQLTINTTHRIYGNEGTLGATATIVKLTLIYKAYDASGDGDLYY